MKSFLLGFSLISNFFNVQKVDCHTQFGPCPPYLSEVTQKLIGYPLYRPLPTIQIQQKLAQFSEVRSVNLKRRLPNTLIVNVTLRSPIGAVNSSLVDDQGVLYSSADNSPLPLLQIPGSLPDNYLSAVKLLGQVGRFSEHRIVGTLIAPTVLSVFLDKDLQVLLDTQNSPKNWSSSLQLILARSKIGSKIPRKIDLRFSNPVVTY